MCLCRGSRQRGGHQVKEKHKHFGGHENLEGASNVVVTKARSSYVTVVKDPIRDDSVSIHKHKKKIATM